MDNIKFCLEYVDPELCQQNLGDAFQKFVHEILLFEYPDLHLFPTKGKDGAIDLSQTLSVSRTVIECKYAGKDVLNTNDCLSIWHKVKSNLEMHLSDPKGPTKGQAQYELWYRTNLPIQEYVFCISSILSNEDTRDKLKKDITGFFCDISKNRHLSHLDGLSVKVIDWNDFYTRLQQHPHLIFRWFHKTRPAGLIPLDKSLDRGTFRSYLSSQKLAYYSRSQHLKIKPAPPELDILDEEDLMNELENGDTTGLIITGSGGVGKTRLMLEIGRLAKSKGWSVLRVQSRLELKALEDLVKYIIPNDKVLLLIDYIEVHKRFSEYVEVINDYNPSLRTLFFKKNH